MKQTVMMIVFFVLAILAQDKYVQPTQATVDVYEKASGKTVVASVKKTDRLKFISEKKGYYRVQMTDGTEGFIKKQYAVFTSGGALTLGAVDVHAYGKGPTSIYIFDTDEGENVPVALERSFVDALTQNIDKERVARQ